MFRQLLHIYSFIFSIHSTFKGTSCFLFHIPGLNYNRHTVLCLSVCWSETLALYSNNFQLTLGTAFAFSMFVCLAKHFLLTGRLWTLTLTLWCRADPVKGEQSFTNTFSWHSFVSSCKNCLVNQANSHQNNQDQRFYVRFSQNQTCCLTLLSLVSKIHSDVPIFPSAIYMCPIKILHLLLYI